MVKKEETIETGLILTGSKEFGKTLLEEAAKMNQEKIGKVVISTIAELPVQIEEQTKAVNVLKSMHEALSKGQFVLNRNGQITYTDPQLNESIRWISKCSQCGYDKIVTAVHRGGY